MEHRQSTPIGPVDERETLIPEGPEREKREATNGIQQYLAAESLIEKKIKAGEKITLRPSMLLDFNRYAIEGIWRSAGVYRTKPIGIGGGSKHQPPNHQDVPALVEDMCEYVNSNSDAAPIHIAAYLMWMINWIHPFVDGNGRTTRIISYIMLCDRLGFKLPGTLSIPEQISTDKREYYECLEAADVAYADGKKIDVSKMETLISKLLAQQLLSIHDKACT